MTTNSELLDISEILYDNYYTLGVTGADAIVNIYDEIDAGYFADQIVEWGIDIHELFTAIAMMRKRLVHEKKLSATRYPT
jgi:hypothetical protein